MKKAALFLIVAVAMVTIGVSQGKASALSGAEFIPGRIIDDSLFFNGQSMNTSNIQNFLNSKVPSCDTNGSRPRGGTTRAAYGASQGYPPPYTCLKDYSVNTPSMSAESGLCDAYSGGTKSAASIINDVSVACGVSPKVLLILLEKEQSLITDDWPWNIQYTKATGYGCPDSALGTNVDANQNGCYDEFEGFFNQVYYGARQYKRYQRDAHLFSYRAGRDNYIQFNPNAACGGTNVFILNQATAGLYNYTPYQPNGAALNNLNGTGDGCSAYGNRNFWKLYNDWFGKTISQSSLIYEPAIVSQAPGKINVFARGLDRRMWQNWYQENQWQEDWNWLDGPSPQSGSPSAISWGEGHMDVFETRNGQLWHSWYTSDGGWRWWSPIGAPNGVSIAGTVTAVSQAPGKINVFARGTDGRLWQTWYDSGSWKSWNYIDGPVSGYPTPNAASWEDGHMDVFELRDGGVWHTWYTAATGWSGWQPLTYGRPEPSGLKKAVSVTSQAPGKLNLFARGDDGRLWQTWFDSNGWNRWNYIDGPSSFSSVPTSFSWADGHMDVYEIRGGAIWHTWYNADSSGWRPLQSVGMP